MAFYVGQKVVCMDDENSGKFLPPGTPCVGGMDGIREGVVYTIRAVGRRHPDCPLGSMIWLEEIVRPVVCSLSRRFGEIGYDLRRFRPITERKTDISIFKAMLNPSKTEVEA